MLSESVTTTETVEIPGELKLSNPIPPPVSVRLPIMARPRWLMNVVLGLVALPIGVLLCAPLIALVFGTDDLSPSVLGIFLVALSLSLLGVSFTGAALTCFWDAIGSDPVLEITADGLYDRRSGLSVPWSAVGCARILGSGVDLQLRGQVTNWQNPFRVGVLFHRYRPRPDHVIVSIAYLDVRPHVLAYTILTPTQLNGGEAFSKAPGPAFDMGLKTIPRKSA